MNYLDFRYSSWIPRAARKQSETGVYHVFLWFNWKYDRVGAPPSVILSAVEGSDQFTPNNPKPPVQNNSKPQHTDGLCSKWTQTKTPAGLLHWRETRGRYVLSPYAKILRLTAVITWRRPSMPKQAHQIPSTLVQEEPHSIIRTNEQQSKCILRLTRDQCSTRIEPHERWRSPLKR